MTTVNEQRVAAAAEVGRLAEELNAALRAAAELGVLVQVEAVELRHYVRGTDLTVVRIAPPMMRVSDVLG